MRPEYGEKIKEDLTMLKEKRKLESWYEENIEEPIRDIVKHLRENGFNTECSCGHEMYVQCQYLMEGEIFRLHQLVYNYLSEKKLPINYDIEVRIKVMDGHAYPSLDITFPKENTNVH